MAAVAQWLIGGGFTAAEKNLAVRLCFKAHRRKSGVHVRAIAEGLTGTEAAGTPEIGVPCFDLDAVGGVRCALGFIHNQVPFAVYYCVVGALII